MKISSISKTIFLAIFFLAIIVAQLGYDGTKKSVPQTANEGFSPVFMRLADLGFHSTLGSFVWITTMPEVLDIYFRGNTSYLDDLAYVNALDPRLSYPYAFSVITLPALQRLQNKDSIAIAIGERGIKDGDPDWRVPYYMAADYYLDLKDTASALKYYDLAAHTLGVPLFAKQFATNFSALPDDRAKTKALWISIRDTSGDEAIKERAQAYVDRLDILDYLDAASKAYKAKTGTLPADIQTLVDAHVIPFMPQDPFGAGFIIQNDGTAGIKIEKSE